MVFSTCEVCYTTRLFTTYTPHIIHAYSSRYPALSIYDHLHRWKNCNWATFQPGHFQNVNLIHFAVEILEFSLRKIRIQHFVSRSLYFKILILETSYYVVNVWCELFGWLECSGDENNYWILGTSLEDGSCIWQL